jgi:uracil phosphoribosyltransferase
VPKFVGVGRSGKLSAMPVVVHHVDHPLIADSLVRVRDVNTPNALFRQELERIGSLLLAEATRSLETHVVKVTTPLVETEGRALTSQPIVIPVLRAGLGFLHAAQELLPNADVGFIGVARDEETFQPKQYVNKLPETIAGRQCIVLDPMLATGGSLAHACRLLLERGATGTIIVVCVLAAPEGIAVLEAAGLDLAVYTAAVDERLNDSAFIVPGLGDAGDRQFGSPA